MSPALNVQGNAVILSVESHQVLVMRASGVEFDSSLIKSCYPPDSTQSLLLGKALLGLLRRLNCPKTSCSFPL